eukprot:36687-Prymnesium_polylepis.1
MEVTRREPNLLPLPPPPAVPSDGANEPAGAVGAAQREQQPHAWRKPVKDCADVTKMTKARQNRQRTTNTTIAKIDALRQRALKTHRAATGVHTSFGCGAAARAPMKRRTPVPALAWIRQTPLRGKCTLCSGINRAATDETEEHHVRHARHAKLHVRVVDARFARAGARLRDQVDYVHDDGAQHHGRARHPLLLHIFHTRGIRPLEARHVGVDLEREHRDERRDETIRDPLAPSHLSAMCERMTGSRSVLHGCHKRNDQTVRIGDAAGRTVKPDTSTSLG